MASGRALRCQRPYRETLDFQLSTDVTLYKAPPNKDSRINLRYTPLLDQLPLEILHLIFLDLDLPSLGMLRRVSRIGRRLVESLPAYSLLRALASDTLRVMDMIKCSSYFPIGWLFAEFCYPWCRTCTDFGPLLYFPTLTRSCYKCNFLQPDYQVEPVRDVCFRFGLTPNDLRRSSLPIIHPINRHRPRLMDVTQAEALGTKLHGGGREMEQAYQFRLKERERDYHRRVQQWEKHRRQGTHTGGRPRRRLKPTSLDENEDSEKPSWRIQATATFPYWDVRTQILEPGTYCKACTYHWEEGNANDWRRMETIWHPHPPSREAYYRAFLEADLPRHFLNCVAVKENYDFRVKRPSDIFFRRHGTDFIVGPKNNTDV
ncbi:hypothetical protein F9C07_5178 [Aspergillus flavus]|uniref:F-box domain-containing protein n=5 Tax=Aspergillus subgen. Circumdati TaxID=2720871 RepID=A0A7U2MWI4_ASPFN|nr:hypothetical protein F9C07_5178 [Aspergillus flavus]